jgi:hypothetical protein
MTQIHILTGVALLALGACSQQANADNRLHPLRALCVDYEQTGTMSGTTTQCHRDWGHEQFQIERLSMSIMGMQRSENKHTIIEDEQVTSWDLDTNVGTVANNPMYDAVVGAAGGDVDQFATNMLTSMGFTDTGTDKEIVGINCSVWNSPQMGQMCFTDDAIMLEQTLNMGIVNFTSRAVDVRRGDAGDASNYQVPNNVTISEAPDISNIMGGFGN